MDIASFIALNNARQSCRDYDNSRTIDPELIRSCLRAAATAPSACNKQPARFIVVSDPELRAAICAHGLLPGISMSWLRNAPVITVLCSTASSPVHWFAPFFSGVPYDILDAGIAGEHFVLAAAAQGLGTCWIGWFNPKRVRKILSIPKTVRPIALISLGYPMSVRENTPKKNEQEISFENKWGLKSNTEK